MAKRRAKPAALDHRTLTEIRRHLSSDAIVAKLRRAVPANPKASKFGEVTCMEAGEKWPRIGGLPAIGLLQINTAELPTIPSTLEGVAMLRVWVADDLGEIADPSAAIIIRASSKKVSFRSLAPTDKIVPKTMAALTPCGIKWLPYRDPPSYYDLPRCIDERIALRYDNMLFGSSAGTKIGGYPRRIQWGTPFEVTGLERDDARLDYEYVLQIGSEDLSNWMWGDAGVAYIGRHRTRRDRWYGTWECS